MDNTEIKKQQIIRAAINRFSHFGIFKTAMSEIAEDCALSKANLYYYFPDKWTLIDAIVETFQIEADEHINQIFVDYKKVSERLLRINDFQFEYYGKYKMLFQNFQEFNPSEPKMCVLVEKQFDRECKIIERVLKDGLESGEIVTTSVENTSKTYVTILRGLVHLSLFSGATPGLGIMDPAKFEEVHQLRKEAILLITSGLVKQSA